jgi:hypothetical protein
MHGPNLITLSRSDSPRDLLSRQVDTGSSQSRHRQQHPRHWSHYLVYLGSTRASTSRPVIQCLQALFKTEHGDARLTYGSRIA